jgi:hypothetical protein
MPGAIRHDAITLHSDVKEEDLEGFMETELMPYFSERYKGPTRASVADLTHQFLLKDAESRGTYLWVTVWEVWDRSPEAVRGASFEHTRMIRFEETDTLLKKLESFGTRSSVTAFSELVSLEVTTKT